MRFVLKYHKINFRSSLSFFLLFFPSDFIYFLTIIFGVHPSYLGVLLAATVTGVDTAAATAGAATERKYDQGKRSEKKVRKKVGKR